MNVFDALILRAARLRSVRAAAPSFCIKLHIQTSREKIKALSPLWDKTSDPAVPPKLTHSARSFRVLHTRRPDNGCGPRQPLLSSCRSLCPRKSIRRKVLCRDPTTHGSLKGDPTGYSSCSSVYFDCFALYVANGQMSICKLHNYFRRIKGLKRKISNFPSTPLLSVSRSKRNGPAAFCGRPVGRLRIIQLLPGKGKLRSALWCSWCWGQRWYPWHPW